MDIDKLIDEYQKAADKWETRRPDFRVQDALRDAAAALSTLQTENEKLRAELSRKDEALDFARTTDAEMVSLGMERDKLRADLARVTAERDAAVEDLEEIMSKGGHNIDTCHFCTNGQCYGRGGTLCCEPKWRGVKED